ncbi:lysine-specific demethylase 4B [Pectobacterium phage PcCB7V]|nr:lysine-specific demethylase 4B [Pectobacterium phage PcCB7V]
MNDYRGTPLKEGDKVAIYWYNEPQGGIIRHIKGNKAKVEVLDTVSKWKSGSCMVKLED